MKSFKRYILETNLEFPNTQPFLKSPENIGSGSIFTKSAGYKQKRPEEYNPEHSALIHMTSFFPLGGKIKTLGSQSHFTRETLHFTRNGVVNNHLWGNWSGAKYGIMIPESKLSSRLNGSGSHDSWTVGNVDIPHGSKIIMDWSSIGTHERNHVAALTGSKTHEEALEKINKGHSVSFGKNAVTLKSARENETVHDGVLSHLTNSGIRPIDYTLEGALGYSKLNPDFYEQKEDQEKFNADYGIGGNIEKFYGKQKPDVATPQDLRSTTTKFRSGSGNHADSTFSHIEHHFSQMVRDTRRKDKASASKRIMTSGVNYLGAIDRIVERPNEHHSSFDHPEAIEAMKRLKSKLIDVHSGVPLSIMGNDFNQARNSHEKEMIQLTKSMRTQ
jgi:hypothetical protein